LTPAATPTDVRVYPACSRECHRSVFELRQCAQERIRVAVKTLFAIELALDADVGMGESRVLLGHRIDR